MWTAPSAADFLSGEARRFEQVLPSLDCGWPALLELASGGLYLVDMHGYLNIQTEDLSLLLLACICDILKILFWR